MTRAPTRRRATHLGPASAVSLHQLEELVVPARGIAARTRSDRSDRPARPRRGRRAGLLVRPTAVALARDAGGRRRRRAGLVGRRRRRPGQGREGDRVEPRLIRGRVAAKVIESSMGRLRLMDEAVRVFEQGLQACADARRDTRRRSFFASAHRVHFRRRILIRADLLRREALALATRLRRRCDHGRGGVRRLALRLFHPSTLLGASGHTNETLALDRFKIHRSAPRIRHSHRRPLLGPRDRVAPRPIVSVAPQARAMSA